MTSPVHPSGPVRWEQGPAQRPEYWLPPGPQLPRRRFQRDGRIWILIATVIGSVVMVIVVLAAMLVSGVTFTARVDVAVEGEQTCTLPQDYAVVVGDEAGATWTSVAADGGRPRGGACVFGFEVAGVPRFEDRYYVSVGLRTGPKRPVGAFSELDLTDGVVVAGS